MSDATADNNRSPLPADDGSIEQALSDLAAKLSAWTAMVQELQPSGRSEPRAEGVQAATARAEEQAASTRESDLPPIRAPAGSAPARSSDQLPSGTPQTLGTRASGGRSPPVSPGERRSNESPLPCEPPSREDEALLATLEPEIARDVRILRRLDPQPRPIRELIAEVVNNRRPRESAGSARKKSWWRG